MTFGDVMVNFSGYTAKDKNGRIDITPKEIDLLRIFESFTVLTLQETATRAGMGLDCIS